MYVLNVHGEEPKFHPEAAADAYASSMWPLVDIGLPPEGYAHALVRFGDVEFAVIVEPASDGSRWVDFKRICDEIVKSVEEDKKWAQIPHLETFGAGDILDSNPQRYIL